MRKDSLVTSALVIQKIHHWAKEREDGTVATVGKVRTVSDIINAIPGETIFTVDIRHPQESQLYDCIEEIKQLIQETAEKNSMNCVIKEVRSHPPVHFSSRIVNQVEEVCRDLQIPYKRMSSGAGHDAMYMNNVTDTGMIFVPSVNGKSHCEEEETSWEDIKKGTDVLYETLLRLAK
jgi:N-carbamoyl-L-amino-acid hydrolase